MNSKLFKPLNEQIQVIKIKRQGIDDAERDLLIESIISEDIVESLTEDVELAALYEECLIETGYDEAKSDELLLEVLGSFYRSRAEHWINKHTNKIEGNPDAKKRNSLKFNKFNNKNKNKDDERDRNLYRDIAQKYAKHDSKILNKMEDTKNSAKEEIEKNMPENTILQRFRRNRALKKVDRDYDKSMAQYAKQTYKRNELEAKDIKRGAKTRDLASKLRKSNEELLNNQDKQSKTYASIANRYDNNYKETPEEKAQKKSGKNGTPKDETFYNNFKDVKDDPKQDNKYTTGNIEASSDVTAGDSKLSDIIKDTEKDTINSGSKDENKQ